MSGSDLWRVESGLGRLILRAWPVDGPTRADLSRIHRWLDPLRALPAVAMPIAGRNGATWFAEDGRFWELTPFLPGTPDLANPPTVPHLAAMFGTLATVHHQLGNQPTFGPSPGLVARCAEVDRLLAGEFAQVRSALAGAATNRHHDLARCWLDLAEPLAPAILGLLRPSAERTVPLQPCIRDVRPDHFLFERDQLTGLVDFGAMGVDSVATDLARLLGETIGSDPRHRPTALAAYKAVRPISADERDLIATFEAGNALLGGARWVRWHFIERRPFRDPAAIGLGLARTVRRLADFIAHR